MPCHGGVEEAYEVARRPSSVEGQVSAVVGEGYGAAHAHHAVADGTHLVFQFFGHPDVVLVAYGYVVAACLRHCAEEVGVYPHPLLVAEDAERHALRSLSGILFEQFRCAVGRAVVLHHYLRGAQSLPEYGVELFGEVAVSAVACTHHHRNRFAFCHSFLS